MTTYQMTSSNDRSSTDATLRWIGDLDHPFYDDERNRYVWYEAQAIGFQFMGLASFLIAAIALLVAGSAAIPYAAAMMAPFVVSGVALKGYVARRGADYWPQSMDFRRSRGLAAIAIPLLLLAGFFRAALGTDSGGSLITGAIIGGLAAGVTLGLGARNSKRREAAAAEIEE